MAYPSAAQLEVIYADRAKAIAVLAAAGRVDADDLRQLDRLGRCHVANELWNVCTSEARDALLHDEHPHVRSCASLAA